MTILKGSILLLLCLSVFSVFSLKAPKGMKAMGALADAAVATFLVEAFQLYVGGNMLGIELLKETGVAAGGMSGAAAATLVPLALGVSPVYSVLIGASNYGLGIIPGFVAGYVLSFIVPKLEEKFSGGIGMVLSVMFIAPLARLIGTIVTPLIDATLLNIGGILTAAASESPIIMGFILGGVITVVATSPLSSMALTAMLGLKGLPMAIGALAVMSSSFMNYVLFDNMKFGDKSTTISVAIEPLSQTHIISANPIPVYVTNFIGGGFAGIIVSQFNLINNATGTATPIAGLMVMYGFNDAKTTTIVAIACALIGILSGYLGSKVFKNYKVRTIEDVNKIAEA